MGAGPNFGMSSWVSTRTTPATVRARATSMLVTRPLAIDDATIAACSVLGGSSSPAYLAAPVTLARPS